MLTTIWSMLLMCLYSHSNSLCDIRDGPQKIARSVKQTLTWALELTLGHSLSIKYPQSGRLIRSGKSMCVNKQNPGSHLFNPLICGVLVDGMDNSQKFCSWVSVPKRWDLNTEYTLSIALHNVFVVSRQENKINTQQLITEQQNVDNCCSWKVGALWCMSYFIFC